jgi:hypothetical protein
VVVIQVTPEQLAAPRRGERAVVNMRGRHALVRMALWRGGQEIAAIESHRIHSVINPTAFPEDQREALFSGLAVFNGADVVEGDGPLEVRVQVLPGRDLVRLPVPASVIEAVRADLASAIR